jgi:mannitol/fructose-specific phosphotransferase system IIA component (Ntr-type)
MSISIGPALHPAPFISELKNRRRDSVLGELTRRAEAIGAVREAELLQSTLLLRERLGPTGLGHGVALPNARSLMVLEPLLLVGRSRRGITWSGPESELVHLVLLVLSPPETTVAAHLDFVARAAAAIRPARARQRLLDSERPADLSTLWREVLP